MLSFISNLHELFKRRVPGRHSKCLYSLTNHFPETELNLGYINRVGVTQRIALRSNASGNVSQSAVLAPLARWRKSM